MSQLPRLKQRELILREARFCLKQGWAVTPVRKGSKAPRIKGWPDLRYKCDKLDEAFEIGDNIGLLTGDASGRLVDIDLDSIEAIEAAPHFLPPTERIHGRKSKPSSHYWYVADATPDSAKYAEKDSTVHVELRGNGKQTLIPPSVHPSSERIYWRKAGEPAHVNGEKLVSAVAHLAACALTARHWPSRGSRHDLTLALSSVLLRANWAEEKVAHFISVAARVAGDEEWETRRNDTISTAARLDGGLNATGIPKIASLVGDAVTKQLLDWIGFDNRPIVSIHEYPQKWKGPIPSWPEGLSKKAFSGLLGEIVAAIEPHSEADPAALLIQCLVAFGNSIGRHAHFSVEADQHYGNLFAVLVGPTAKARKGSSWSQVLRVFHKVDMNWASRCVLSGLSTGEGLVSTVKDSSEVDRSTKKESLNGNLADKRLLVLEPEFSQPLKHMTRNGNILSTVLRQAWDGGSLQTLTKNSPLVATGTHISVIGHITQHDLRRYLHDTELANGFGNRFLWICVQRSKLLPEGGRLRDSDLTRCCTELERVVERAQNVSEVTKTNKARTLWRQAYPALSTGRAGLAGMVTSRAEAQVMRLAMLYALLDDSDVIRVSHLESALAVWKYADDSARYIFGDKLGEPLADAILNALRLSEQGLTRTAISSHFAGHRSSNEIEKALMLLAGEGKAASRTNSTGGRPGELWVAIGAEVGYAR